MATCDFAIKEYYDDVGRSLRLRLRNMNQYWM